MIAEIGHYALVLALGLALIQGSVPLIGVRLRDRRSGRDGAAARLGAIRFCRDLLRGLDRLLCRLRFLGLQCVREFAFGDAAYLQIHERVGKPRRLDAALGADPERVRRDGRGLRPQSAGEPARQCARRSGLDRGGVLSLYSRELESVPAHRERAGRGTRPQSAVAGYRARDPSAVSLSRLCRLFDFVFVCHCRVDRRPHRCGLGALCAAMDPDRLDLHDARHRHGFVLGLLRTRLGRMVVLGSGRECIADAVDRGHGAPSFRGGDGKARRAQGLDHPACHSVLFAVADRHFPGALGRSDVGAFLRHRSDARRLYPGDPCLLHRRRARALCLARAGAPAGRHVRADLARRRACLQQSLSDHGLRDRVHRHALSARARSDHRRKNLGRRAVFQRDLRAACSFRC